MHRAFRIVLIMAGLVAVVAVGSAVIWGFTRTTPSEATFPSGVRVRVLGTRIGGATFSSEKPWEKVARRVLPRGWLGWIPAANNGSCSSGPNSVTVFVELIDPSGARVNALPWLNYFAEEDGTGFRHPRQGGYCSFGGPPGRTIYGLILRSLPRRQADFLLRLTDQKGAVLATLRVPSPVTGPFPEWKPDHLPITRTNGPVILTLKNLRESGSAEWPFVTPEWIVTSDDPQWRESRPEAPDLADATGNEASILARTEPVWRLRTAVHRMKPEQFSASERLVFTNVPCPTTGQLVVDGQRANLGGYTVQLVGTSGPGRISVTNGVNWGLDPTVVGRGSSGNTSDSRNQVNYWTVDKSTILMSFTPFQAEDKIFLRIRDDQGRMVKSGSDSGGSQLQGSLMRMESIEPAAEARSLTIEVYISHPLAFEFMIDPKAVEPLKSGKP